jgi:hypothetical protein
MFSSPVCSILSMSRGCSLRIPTLALVSLGINMCILLALLLT